MAFLLAAVLVAFDQLSKAWVARNLPLNQADIPVVPGLGITHTHNNGAAFGLLRDVDLTVLGVHVDGTVLLGLLSAVVSIGLVAYLATQGRRLDALQRLALSLVLAGAAGNMIDRLRLGYVIDFLHLRSGSFSFPVFNVADVCVVVGAGLLILGSLRTPEAEPQTAALPDAVDPSDEDEGVAYPARPVRAAVKTARERKRPLEDYPDLPPLHRVPEAD